MDAPSLEHLVLAKVTTTLWSSVDIKGIWAQHSNVLTKEFPVFDVVFSPMMNKVKENLSKLAGLLPASYQSKIKNIVTPIGNQIALCNNFFTKTCGLEINFPYKFFWTSEGTMDEAKTAEELIKNENLNITTRYKLACHCCLENYVCQLWNELPQSEKELYYNEDAHKKIEEQTLITFWTYNINRQLSKLDDVVGELTFQRSTLYQYVFEQAAIARNIAALKYFLERLSPSEREMSLERAIESLVMRLLGDDEMFTIYAGRFVAKEYYGDIVCFLFSKMDKRQQIKTMKEDYSSTILDCFLDWPWQSSFMNMARPMLPYIPERDYNELLQAIIFKMEVDCKDYDYLKLFGIFWQESYITNRENAKCTLYYFLLSKLSKVENSKNIRLLLREINLEEIKNYIFSDRAQTFFDDCSSRGRWHLLEIIIQEFMSRMITSKNELERLRDMLKEHVKWKFSDGRRSEMRCRSEKFLKTLDALF